MPLDGFTVKSRFRDYKVSFASPEEYIDRLAAEPNSVAVIDENVWRLHRDGALKPFSTRQIIPLPISEELKSLESVQKLYDRIVEFAPKKNMHLVSVGGGITQDITGFVASTLYRGIKWTFVPTTLLAQADSCIGGKTSLNYRDYKNLIGTFYPPADIFLSADFLATLSDNDYLSGMGEVAKLSIIGGESAALKFSAALPSLLKREPAALMEFLRLVLTVKKGYIEDDELDSGRRNILNFGHCFGHAIESATNFRVPHGTAVVYGMLLANMVAKRRGVLSASSERAFSDNFLRPLLNIKLREDEINPSEILSGMKKDKKRIGDKLPLVMVADGFRMLRINDLDESEVVGVLSEIKKLGL